MDNTDKLLRALIDVMGYEIEEVMTDEIHNHLGIHRDILSFEYILTKKLPPPGRIK